MGKDVNFKLAIGIVILVSVLAGWTIWLMQYQTYSSGARPVKPAVKAEDNKRFCTMEAKQCPDGSYVGRSGPKCEFSPCPGQRKGDVVGGDKDEHGCLPSAGYSWCEKKQKCLRTWEEACPK